MARKKTPSATPSPKFPNPSPRPSPPPSRPLLRVALALSLDGYIADAQGGVDWLDAFHSPEINFAAFARTIGHTIWGRATFDWAHARRHPFDASTTVLTRRPLPTPTQGSRAEAFAGDPRALIARLRARLAGSGKDIWLGGGGRSIQPFDEAGLIDRWELAVMPVLLGQGIPLFPTRNRPHTPLTLTHHRALKNGILELHYTPKTPPADLHQ